MKIFNRFIIYPLQFIIFLKIYFFFKLLSNKTASNLGGKIFKILGPLSKTNLILINNLKNIYTKDEKKISHIVNKSWENLGRTLAEFSHLEEITKKNNKYITVKGANHLNSIAKKKEKVIFIAIHQSNWEVLAPTLGSYGIKLNSVYRHVNNNLIDKFILNIRKKVYKPSNSILSPKGKKSAQDMMSSIKKCFSIALLIDQKDSSGLSVLLLGKLAKTQTGFLKLSNKFNLKIYPIENKRISDIKFEMTVHNPVILTKNKEFDEKTAMHQIHKIIEKWIQNQPENWLWQHKRWG